MAGISSIKTCIKSGTRAKVVLTVLCVLMLLFNHDGGFAPGCKLYSRLSYSFCHTNVWHMLCNLFVLWGIRNKLCILPAYAIAVAASWLPMWVDNPTVGMSGLLFAMFGIMWGKTGMAWKCVKTGAPVIVLTMLFPNVNGLLHLYCYVVGFVVGLLYARYKRSF